MMSASVLQRIELTLVEAVLVERMAKVETFDDGWFNMNFIVLY